MADRHPTIALIAASLGLLLVSCTPGDADAAFDRPPESTYVVSTAQLQLGGTRAEVEVAQVTAEFFAILDRPTFLGRAFLPQEFEELGGPVVLLSHRLWEEQLGGSPEIIGRTLQLDEHDRTVVGVMPPGIEWPSGVGVWIPRNPQP
jgi:hypothetical protein